MRYPPAVEQEDAYNLVKFYTLERSLVYSILAATFTDKLEFPFLPDEAEHLIISLSENRSVLLIGRSGTGKTTIVVQRMWLKFRTHMEAMTALEGSSSERSKTGSAVSGFDASQEAGGGPVLDQDGTQVEAPLLQEGSGRGIRTAPSLQVHQLFVTANPILCTSVAKSFKALQSGFVASMAARSAGTFAGDPPSATLVMAAEDDEPMSLSNVPENSWPLFLRAHHWLRLLDGTLDEGSRFFSDDERAGAATAAAGWHTEKGSLDELPSLLDEVEEDDDDDDEGGEPEASGGEGSAAGASGSKEVIRQEINFDTFERTLWPLMLGKGMPGSDDARGALADVHMSKDLLDKVRKAPVKASLVFREIVSYIKGSSQALTSPNGRLSRQAYLRIGKKMAPAFDKVEEADGKPITGAIGRELVYDLYLKYEI